MRSRKGSPGLFEWASLTGRCVLLAGVLGCGQDPLGPPGSNDLAALEPDLGATPPADGGLDRFPADTLPEPPVPPPIRFDPSIAVGGTDRAFTRVRIGDMNGDKIPDLATVSVDMAEIRLGLGGGTFRAATSFPIGGGAADLALADLNGDQKLDFVIAAPSKKAVCVMLGNADGTLGPPVMYPGGNAPESVAVADMNGDGKVDVIAGSPSYNTITILLGPGDGTLPAAVSMGAPQGWRAGLAVADFDGDKHLDVAYASQGSIGWLAGKGDGTLLPNPRSVAVWQAHPFVAADFNADGAGDLAVLLPDEVVILLGGNGGLQVSDRHRVRAWDLVALDTNADNRLDVVVTSSSTNVLLGAGDGTFAPPYSPGGMLGALRQVAGDLNGDGLPDVVGIWSEALSFFWGAGNGRWKGEATLEPGGLANAIAAADLDKDGRLDLIGAGTRTWQFEARVSVLSNLGNLAFATPVGPRTDGSVLALALGDFDGVAGLDLAALSPAATDGRYFPGDGAGNFRKIYPQRTYPIDARCTAVLAADLDRNGTLDLVHLCPADGSIRVCLGHGNGTFRAPAAYPTPNEPSAVALGDFDGDNAPDLAVASYAAGTVRVLVNDGAGAFAWSKGVSPAGGGPVALVNGDWNGDGALDVAVANRDEGEVGVLLGRGDGTFAPATRYAAGKLPVAIAAADFNRDGPLDLAVANGPTSQVNLLAGRGNGMFEPRAPLEAPGSPHAILAADLDGDARPELVVSGEYYFRIFRNVSQ